MYITAFLHNCQQNFCIIDQMNENILLLSSWIAAILYIILETDAIVKWSKLLRIKALKYQEYESFCSSMMQIKYKDFMRMKYNNFFVNLIFCQECLCVWLNILAFFFFSGSVGGWKCLGLCILLSMIEIGAVKKLLKKLYE